MYRTDQADRGIMRIVEPVPFAREEHMARHLTAQRRGRFDHFGLHEAVAGLPHHRLAAQRRDMGEQHLAGLHIGDDRCAGMLGERGGGQDHQDLVTPDHPALAIDRTDSIAIAIESEPKIEASAGDQPFQPL